MNRRWQWSDLAYGLAFLLAFLGFLRVLSPFLGPLVLAALVVALVSPLYERMAHRLGGRRRLAALLASVGVLLAVVLPSVLVAFLLVEQAAELLGRLATLLGEGSLTERLGRLGWLFSPVVERLEALGIAEALRGALGQLGTLLSHQIGPALGALAELGIGTFILLVGIYYLFQDGPALFEEIVEIVPMDPAHAREMGADLAAVLRSLFLATFFTGIVQGILGFVAFAIVDVPQALAWAALMAFCSILFSLVPLLGTGLVWVPVAIWLFLQGRWIAGLFILGWGLLVLGSVDNVIRPLVTRATGSLHPLLVLVTVLGGVSLFGPLGAILGPLVGAVAAAFVRVWIRDVRPRLG